MNYSQNQNLNQKHHLNQFYTFMIANIYHL